MYTCSGAQNTNSYLKGRVLDPLHTAMQISNVMF